MYFHVIWHEISIFPQSTPMKSPSLIHRRGGPHVLVALGQTIGHLSVRSEGADQTNDGWSMLKRQSQCLKCLECLKCLKCLILINMIHVCTYSYHIISDIMSYHIMSLTYLLPVWPFQSMGTMGTPWP